MSACWRLVRRGPVRSPSGTERESRGFPQEPDGRAGQFRAPVADPHGTHRRRGSSPPRRPHIDLPRVPGRAALLAVENSRGRHARRIDELRGDVEDLSDQIQQASAEGSSSASRLSDLIAQRGSIQGRIEALQQSWRMPRCATARWCRPAGCSTPPPPSRAGQCAARARAGVRAHRWYRARLRDGAVPRHHVGPASTSIRCRERPRGGRAGQRRPDCPAPPSYGAGCPRSTHWTAAAPMSASD